MPSYILRFDPADEGQIHIQLAGLARTGDTPWHERFRGGFLELYSNDKELMRRVWKATKRWQCAPALVED